MRFIDFFAGIGGFTKGLTQAGMRCAGFCEKDKFAIRSYHALHNPDAKEWFSDDITTTKSNDIPYADGWTAGFPCQDISISGRLAGLAGERSGLFFEIIRLLKGKSPENKPQWLLLENVKNLLSIGSGGDFTEVLHHLSEAGYDCEWQVVNSKSYVPQNRERVFIIGHLRTGSSRKVFPIGYTNTKTPVQIIGGSQGSRVYSPSGISVTLTAQGGGGGAKSGLYFIDLNKNPKLTEIARCLKARYDSGVSNRGADNSGVLINGRIRKLTPLECFRLQGFTDEDYYKAKAINSDSQLYKQIGNGVTVPVIYEIGKKVMEVYNG